MKNFKVAHIVPVTHLKDTVDNQYHMCLAHLVDCEEYREHFAEMSKRGKFVLMDNGAAEGSQLDFEELFRAYEKISPTEIVLPDTLLHSCNTIVKTLRFLDEMEHRGAKYRTMAVPQGKTFEEWLTCAGFLIQDKRINSIGISKFLNITTKDKYVRFRACGALSDMIDKYRRHDLEVHLLGCDEGPLVVKMCHEAYPFVRGCDSAFSYLQAQAKKMMTLADDKRPEGTIDFIGGAHKEDFTKYMKNFDLFAGVTNNLDDDSWR